MPGERTIGAHLMKAADITADAFLAAVDDAARLRGFSMATRWDVAAVLAGHPEDVGENPVDYPEVPERVVLAKARKLIRQGRMGGCACGCRGDFSR